MTCNYFSECEDLKALSRTIFPELNLKSRIFVVALVPGKITGTVFKILQKHVEIR
jgi:hypothetical protein